MPRRAVLPLLVLAGGCLWLPVGSDARPAIGLEAVERASASGGPPAAARPAREPGDRGHLFEDSLIAFRTRANHEVVRFRLWNKGPEPLRIAWDVADPAGRPARECPASAGEWELQRQGGRADVVTVPPGGSHEAYALPRARLADGDAEWRSVRMACLAYEAAAPRAALRLWVEAAGGRFLYTVWYRSAAAHEDDPRSARPPDP